MRKNSTLKKMYIAVIGDLVDSKHLKARNGVQEKLKEVLLSINNEYSIAVSSKLMITLGDEFQGLLQVAEPVIEIIEKIAFNMHPVKIRFGIGIGEISTAIDFQIPLGADGPAYYHAREVINQLKSNERKKLQVKSDIGIISDDTNINDELLNMIFSQNYFIKQKWTERQREIIACYLQENEVQSEVAKSLGINQSSIQRSLKASGFYIYKQALQSIKKELMKMKEVQDV